MALILQTPLLAYGFQPLKQMCNLRNTISHFKHSAHRLENASLLLHQRCYSTKQSEKTSQDGYQLIYNGSLTKYIRNLKTLSLLTSFGAIATQPLLYQKVAESDNMTLLIVSCSILGAITAGTPLLIHSVTKKYATHLYYDEKEDKYLATTYTMFLRQKKIEFTPDDVVIPDVTGIFTTCKVKGIPLFFDESQFQDLNHYKRIMGYDKPLEFAKYFNKNNIDTDDEPPQEKNK